MTDPSDEFRRYMKAIDEVPERQIDEHPDERELIAYLKNSLGATEKARVQRHLAECARCREASKDLTDFFEPAREGEEAVGEMEIARAWRSLERRLEGERRTSWLPSSSVLALAASLLLALSLGVWTVELNRRAGELESRLSAREARLGELETENRELQASGARFEAEIAELKQPRANAPIFDVFSREWIQRSGGEAPVAEVRVPPEARSYVLVLSGEGQPSAGEHVLDILDRSGGTVWRGEGLKRDPHGSFVLTLDRSFLKDGDYRLVLYSRRAGQLVRVTEYMVRVNLGRR